MQNVIAEDVALIDLKALLAYHKDDDTITDETIKENYPDVLKSIMRGFLDVSDVKAPKLKLREPILDENNQVDMDEIKFKTRILPSEMEKMMKGINMSKDQGKFIAESMRLVSGLVSTAYFDKLNKFDYKVIQQISEVFM